VPLWAVLAYRGEILGGLLEEDYSVVKCDNVAIYFGNHTLPYADAQTIKRGAKSSTVEVIFPRMKHYINRGPERWMFKFDFHTTATFGQGREVAERFAVALLTLRNAARTRKVEAREEQALQDARRREMEKLERNPALIEQLRYENSVLSKRLESLDLTYVAPRTDRSRQTLSELERENAELKRELRSLQRDQSLSGTPAYSAPSPRPQAASPEQTTESLGDRLLKEQEEKEKIDLGVQMAEQRRQENKRHHTAIEWAITNGYSKEIGVRDPLTGNTFWLKPREGRSNRFIPATTGRKDAKCQVDVFLLDSDGRYRRVASHVFEESGHWVFRGP
jgi:hypothetical protein